MTFLARYSEAATPDAQRLLSATMRYAGTVAPAEN